MTTYLQVMIVSFKFQVGPYGFIQTANVKYKQGSFDIVDVVVDGSLVPLIVSLRIRAQFQ